MTPGWPFRPAPGPRLIAGCLCLGLLVAPPVLAQGGGSAAPTERNPAGRGPAGQPGQGGQQRPPGPGPLPGQAVQNQPSRDRVLQQERDAGLATSPERRQEQLRDLNAISRQIAPGVPAPAPGVGGSGSGAR